MNNYTPPLKTYFTAQIIHALCNYAFRSLLTSMAFVGGNVLAQNNDTNINYGIEEVVVTAQRRSENMQSVPIAITAFSKTDLKNQQVNTLGDIQNVAPNLTLHAGDAANAVVYIRGVGQIDSLAFTDPGVGIYLDDIYLGRAQGSFLDVFDVERIEVLRGPQGTLYGRNTIGGAVKFISTAPSDEFTGEVEGTIGNYGRLDIKATASGPLIGQTVLGKFSIAKMIQDGFANNAFNGNDSGDKEALAWRSSLRFLPNDNWQVDFSLDGSRDNPDSSRTPSRETSVFGIVAPNSDPFEVDANFDDLSQLEVFGSALTVTWQASDQLNLKSITSARTMDYKAHLDLDATPLPLFGVFVDQDQEQFSQEIQANYTNGTNLDAVAGVYYFHEKDITESGVFGPAIAFVSNSENDQNNKSFAIYSQVDYQLLDLLKLTGGLRYTRENKEFSRVQEFFAATDPFPVSLGNGFQVTNIKVDDSWSSVSPKLGLEYQVLEDAMLYASASRGFKSGGFDGRTNNPFEASSYDPEIMWSYEVGIKSEWFDHRLRLNSALFFNAYDDLQLSSFVANSNTGNFEALFTNAGKATIQGLEIELTAMPTEAFSFDLTLGYMDAQYDEYIGANGNDISDQHELVNTPELSARFAPQYRFSFNSGELIFGADISYRSKVYTTVSSSEILAQNSYSIVNAAITYLSADSHWRVMLGGKNLTDKRYLTHGFDLSDSLGYQLGYYGAPRTYSLSLGYNF